MLIGIMAVIAIWLLISFVVAGIYVLIHAAVVDASELEQYGYKIRKVVHLENVIETKGESDE